MSELTLEQKIDKLLRLEEQNRASIEVQNLISKFFYLQEAGMFEERWDLLANKTPGVRVEAGVRGVFEGKKHAYETMVTHEKIFETSHAQAIRAEFPDLEFETPHTGMLETSVVGTPVIEVAGDCKTAKGIWMAIMMGAKARLGANGQPKPFIVWWKIAADFVVEDGQWKIWHLAQNPLFTGDFEPDWVEQSKHMPPVPKPNATWKNVHKVEGVSAWPVPDRPTTEVYNPYRIDRTPKNFPAPPEPYETFDETTSY